MFSTAQIEVLNTMMRVQAIPSRRKIFRAADIASLRALERKGLICIVKRKILFQEGGTTIYVATWNPNPHEKMRKMLNDYKLIWAWRN